jgi:hypothetical protein
MLKDWKEKPIGLEGGGHAINSTISREKVKEICSGYSVIPTII